MSRISPAGSQTARLQTYLCTATTFCWQECLPNRSAEVQVGVCERLTGFDLASFAQLSSALTEAKTAWRRLRWTWPSHIQPCPPPTSRTRSALYRNPTTTAATRTHRFRRLLGAAAAAQTIRAFPLRERQSLRPLRTLRLLLLAPFCSIKQVIPTRQVCCVQCPAGPFQSRVPAQT